MKILCLIALVASSAFASERKVIKFQLADKSMKCRAEIGLKNSKETIKDIFCSSISETLHCALNKDSFSLVLSEESLSGSEDPLIVRKRFNGSDGPKSWQQITDNKIAHVAAEILAEKFCAEKNLGQEIKKNYQDILSSIDSLFSRERALELGRELQQKISQSQK